MIGKFHSNISNNSNVMPPTPKARGLQNRGRQTMIILIQNKSWMFIDSKNITSITIDARCPELEISMTSGKKIYINKKCKRLLNLFSERSCIAVKWLWSSIIQLNYCIDKMETNKNEKK